MAEFDKIGEDLFNKIRGRFPSVTIGDQDGNVTNEPNAARFFDFDYKTGSRSLGKVSVSISEDNGLTVIYSKDFIQNENELTQNEWYNFLKELRVFSKKRMLDFSVRDINKSNLNKRDYQFLANRSEDGKMTESRLYGSSRMSYQKFENARMVIKHTESINTESAGGRTQKIGAIYIESSEGERFKYPYKHLSGARAMTRHVSEGGKPYDDFGTHITGLSEEMAKLRKFKTYMGRSSVMAESLAGYMDIVKERISTVKKTIENLQKPAYYAEAVSSFEKPVMEEVPGDVAENWIDELTIKQFNEELADVFPYIYNLVKEGTKAKALGPDDIIDESGLQYYTGVKKHGKEYMKKAAEAGRKGASQEELGRLKDKYSKAEKKTKEEFELEQAFEDTMGQFADHVCEDCGNPSWRTFTESEKQKGLDGKACWKGYRRMGTKMKGGRRVDNCVKVKEDDIEEGKWDYPKDITGSKPDVYWDAGNTRKKAARKDHRKKIKAKAHADLMKGKQPPKDNVDEAENDVAVAWMEKHEPYIEYHINAANNALKAGNEAERDDHREIAKAHRRAQIQWEMNTNDGKAETMSTKAIQASKAKGADIDEGNAFAHAVRKAKMDGKKKGDKIQGPGGDDITLEKEQKTPLGEFILSYFDRHSGQFPKGETAVLTMVEKDYGEEFIEPAKAFIEQINNLVAERFGYKEPDIQEDDYELNDISRLAGL